MSTSIIARMRSTSKKMSFLPLLLMILLFQNCTAWPAVSAVIMAMKPSGGSSPLLFLPQGSSAQPQDNPTPSNSPDSTLDPDTGEVPITPALPSPEVLVGSRSGNLVSESGTSVVVNLKLSAKPNHPVSLNNLTVSEIGELSFSPASFVFTSANWNVDQTLTITGISDSIQDGDRQVKIFLGNTDSTDSLFHNFDAGEIEVVNVDIDSVGIAISPLAGILTSESGSSDTIAIVLNSKPISDVTLPIVISNPSEAISGVGSVTFTPSNWNIVQNVMITGVDDSTKDGDVPFTIQFGPSSSSDPKYQDLYSSLANATNLDNDTASVILSSSVSAPYLTSENTTTIGFQVVLSSKPTSDVTIPVMSLNPAEGRPNVASLVFTPLNWNLAQNLVVTGQNDDTIDGDKLYSIRLDIPVSADLNYSNLNQLDIDIVNLDNDSSGLVFQNHLNLTTGENGTNTNFKVKLRSKPSASVTINLESSDITEATVSPASITFTSANWNAFQTIQLKSVNDSFIDGDISYNIEFNSITSTDSDYNGLVVLPLVAVNLDDDTPGVMIFGADAIVTTESQTTPTRFEIRLKTRPTDIVRFPLIVSNNSGEGTISPSEISFTPANWNVPQQISLQPVRDYIEDSHIIYMIDFNPLESDDILYSGINVASISVTNKNSDTRNYIFSPAITSIYPMVANSGTSDSFTLRLNSKPTGDVIIPLVSLDTGKVVISPPSVVFTPDNWNMNQTITMTGVPGEILASTYVPVALAIGDYDSSRKLYFPTGLSDYSTLAFNDRNGSTTPNGILNVLLFNTDRKVSVLHPRINTRISTTEAGVMIPLQFTLGSAPTSNVVITPISSNPAEGQPDIASITIIPSAWNNFHTINIVGQNDDVIDGHQNYQVSFLVSSADPEFDNYVMPVVLFRNSDLNNNSYIISPSSSITSPYILTRNPGSRNSYDFSVRLRGKPNGTVTVPVQSNSPSDGTLDTTHLTFDSSNWNLPQIVRVTAVDSGARDIKNFTLSVGPNSADPGVDPKFNGNSAFTVFIRNTSPGFPIPIASGNTGEWGKRATFNFILNSPPSATVTCYYYIDNELEAKSITGTVDTSYGLPNVVRRITKTTSNWASSYPITVEGVDDSDIDDIQPFRAVFLPCTSSDSDYNGLTPPSVEFLNEDND